MTQARSKCSASRRQRVLTGMLALASVGIDAVRAEGKEQPPGQGPLRIQEVVSWNDEGLKDHTGKTPDWIELANISRLSIDLAGYSLSDDPEEPLKWAFASGTLAPGESIVVFASGQPERSSGAEIHAGFRLASSGESLVVTGPDGAINDTVEVWATTLADVSQGRLLEAPAQWRFFAEPTPGESNSAEGFDSIAAPVTFSHDAGYYVNPVALELTGRPADELRYTLDGDEPSESDPLYTEPLEIYDRSPEPNGISMTEGTSIANQHTDGWFPPRGLVAESHQRAGPRFQIRFLARANRHTDVFCRARSGGALEVAGDRPYEPTEWTLRLRNRDLHAGQGVRRPPCCKPQPTTHRPHFRELYAARLHVGPPWTLRVLRRKRSANFSSEC